MTPPLTPFAVEWPAAVVEAVLESVRTYRFPVAPRGGGWDYGCDEAFLRRLCTHWTDGYSWRSARDGLNRYPQYLAQIDGEQIHFVHVVGEAGGRRPLLLTHGWPGSHFEFWKMVDALAYPSRTATSVQRWVLRPPPWLRR